MNEKGIADNDCAACRVFWCYLLIVIAYEY